MLGSRVFLFTQFRSQHLIWKTGSSPTDRMVSPSLTPWRTFPPTPASRSPTMFLISPSLVFLLDQWVPSVCCVPGQRAIYSTVYHQQVDVLYIVQCAMFSLTLKPIHSSVCLLVGVSLHVPRASCSVCHITHYFGLLHWTYSTYVVNFLCTWEP